MPCYSTIRTKMNISENLVAALKALGYAVSGDKTHTIIGSKVGEEIRFRRGDTTSAFQVTGDTDISATQEVRRGRGPPGEAVGSTSSTTTRERRPCEQRSLDGQFLKISS
jgi:hypothetical protein